jgi:ABC-type transport system involved in Fe-S cluster assembly fused permease/ATPase subunit
MTLSLLVILICGTANFAMHRWMLESGHPVVEMATGAFRRALGRNATYIIEFALLVGALSLSLRWWYAAVMLYAAYTAMNAATIAWLKGPDERG